VKGRGGWMCLAIAAAGILAATVCFRWCYRPWQASWGATQAEVARPMAGDDLVAEPNFVATRAVTIKAPPECIWPWLVQMGYGRAGFYSYDFLDNGRVPSAEHVLPQYQGLEVGDEVPFDRRSRARVVELEPNVRLVLVLGAGRTLSWSWGLYPIEGGRTRLVSRIHWRVRTARERLMIETFEIFMMRRCMLGIQRRAESLLAAGGWRSRRPQASQPERTVASP